MEPSAIVKILSTLENSATEVYFVAQKLSNFFSQKMILSQIYHVEFNHSLIVDMSPLPYRSQLGNAHLMNIHGAVYSVLILTLILLLLVLLPILQLYLQPKFVQNVVTLFLLVSTSSASNVHIYRITYAQTVKQEIIIIIITIPLTCL